MRDSQDKPQGEGSVPGFRAFHEVYVTKDLGPEKNVQLANFVNKYIAEFKGSPESGDGIPKMLFERRQDAQIFANHVSARLQIRKQDINIRAMK
jgi:hypothetical protein